MTNNPSRTLAGLILTACAASIAPLAAQVPAVVATPELVRTPIQGGQGGALVNAPVAPEAIYIARGRGGAGISVLDLNGYGQGTGQLATSNFPNNPNVGSPGVVPALVPGSSNRDAGGAGPLTLTTDEFGNDLLGAERALRDVSDLAIGQPLDLVYNNSAINPSVVGSQLNPATGTTTAGNTITIAPHPNPPRLIFPAPNPRVGIEAEEPTVTSSVGPAGYPITQSPPCLPSPLNLLALDTRFPGIFYGPQPAPPSPPPPLPFCPYTSRQQIGHFLYGLDAQSQEVVVWNSNRFTVLDRVRVLGASSMAMAPNLKWLAVASDLTGLVVFVDTDPFSPSFHRIVQRVWVGRGAKTMAWQPEGEDLLVTVAGRGRGDLVVIGGNDLRVRKAIRSHLITDPIDVVATARQVRFARSTGTWFGYVLNRDGSIALFESGPDAIGADDVVAQLPLQFPGATTLQPDPGALGAGAYVAHVGRGGQGIVRRFDLTGGPVGPQPVRGLPPLRGRVWTITDSYTGLGNGAPRDLALDDCVNHGAWPDARSPLVPGLDYAEHSGKGHVKLVDGAPAAASSPTRLIVATAQGGVRVVDLGDGSELARHDRLGAVALAHYWRQ